MDSRAYFGFDRMLNLRRPFETLVLFTSTPAAEIFANTRLPPFVLKRECT